MVEFKIMSPLPDILKLARQSKTMKVSIPYSQGLTLYGAIETLSADYPVFADRLKQEGVAAGVGGLLFSIDGKVFDRAGQEDTPLSDGCQVQVFMPYAGG